MIKHTQTSLSVFDHFGILVLKGLQYPKTNTLPDRLIERNSSMLDGIESKVVHKDKEGHQ